MNENNYINQKLIEEISRWKKEVAAGNLSQSSIERIKKEGVAKTPEEYAAGLRRGSLNIAKKAGFKVDESPMKILGGKGLNDSFLGMKTGGAFTNPVTKTIRAPKSYGLLNRIVSPMNTQDSLEKELIFRHEANEAKYYNQLKNNQNSVKNTVTGEPLPMAKVGINGKTLGNHYSMKVISDEAADANFYNNLFGAAKNLKTVRGAIEDPILKDKLGISYNDINHSNRKIINKKISQYEKNVIANDAKQWQNNILNASSVSQALNNSKKAYSGWNLNNSNIDFNDTAKQLYLNKLKGFGSTFLDRLPKYFGNLLSFIKPGISNLSNSIYNAYSKFK